MTQRSPDAPPYLDTRTIDWSTVRRARYEVRQSYCYEYPGPIDDVRQVLIVVPPDCIGGQRLLSYTVAVEPRATPRFDSDRFGNRVCFIALPRVEQRLRFEIRLRIEQEAGAAIVSAPGDSETFLLPSPLAEPFPELQAVAETLRQAHREPQALVEAINQWVYDWISYRHDVTNVRSTARDAFTLRQGVCQDYAQLMIALCRLCGVPARYVSGHLLGEGAMHAWTHVLLPGPDGNASWQSFDPTHSRRAGLSYLTIAVGRDFSDVSPTRGSFRAAYAGRLAGGFKQAGVVELAHA